MNIYSLPPLLGAIANLILGIIVYFKNRNHFPNRIFLLLSLSFTIWNFGVFLLYLELPEVKAVLSAKIVHIAIIWAPVFFLTLVLYYLAIKKRYFLPMIYVFTSFLSILTLTKYIIKGVFKISYTPEIFAFFSQAGPLYPLFFAYMFSVVLYAVWLLLRSLKRSTGLKKAQITYLLIGYMFATVGFNDMLPMLGILKYPFTNFHVYTFGSVTIIFWSLIIAYAIVKHHLMDIDIVIKKGAVYAYLSFSVFIPCVLIILFSQKFFFGYANSFFTFLAFCTLLLAVFVILRVKPDIEEYIEKRLFRHKFEYKKALRELSEIIISFLDEKELFKKAGNIFTKELGAEKVSFFMLDKEKKIYALRASQKLERSTKRELPNDDLFFQWLQAKGKSIVKEAIERIVNDPQIKSITKTMNSMESEVCIPLMARSELIGIINLGHKKSGEMYSHEDLDLLDQFASQASVALENARLYQEMQQTQILLRRTDRLASLGSLTANLAHEIRNPLVTLKTFLDLFPQRYRDKEFRGEFLKLTSSELDRITTLVTDLLSFARPAKPDVKKRDVNQVIEEVIHFVAVEAKKRNVTIDANLQKVRQALLDADQMKQVFLNIFLNAFDAIKNRGIISVTSRDIQKNGMAYVQVEISDNGKGIPEKVLEHIFDPFFSTKKKGGGLGLSISHQIVQEHNGFIEVESKAKKGTTFIVTIPCES